MAIKEERYRQPADKGDVGGIAIHTAAGLQMIAEVLERIRLGERPRQEDIEEIRKSARILSERFDQLSGWSDE